MTSPAWALIKRDLVALLRRRRTFYLLAALVGGCLLTVTAMWPPHAKGRFS